MLKRIFDLPTLFALLLIASAWTHGRLSWLLTLASIVVGIVYFWRLWRRRRA